MDIKKYRNNILAATSGLVITIAIILFTSKPQIKTDVYKVSAKELRDLQSQLTAARVKMDVVKTELITQSTSQSISKNNEYNETNMSFEQPGDKSTDNTSVVRDEVNEDIAEQNIAGTASEEITISTKKWTRIGEEEIAAAFHEINPMDSHLLTTVCESESCQVEISHSDKVAELQFLSSIASSDLIFGYEGYFKNTENEDGSSMSVFYFSRDPQETAIQ